MNENITISEAKASVTREIKISGRKHAGTIIIDNEDYELISKHKWHIRPDTNTFYAHGNDYTVSPKTTIQMHRLIMNCPKNMIVDHINHNGLDNRKVNLRVCSDSSNSKNRSSAKTANSKYLGVWYEPPRNGRKERYRSAIRVNGKLINLCSTRCEQEAAFKYNLAALKYHGEFANINIITRF